MKKVIVRLSMDDAKFKRKALRTVAGIEGVESVSIDMKERKLTVIGNVDPVYITVRLRKYGVMELLSVGPAKEEKKDEKKPVEEKKKDPPPPQNSNNAHIVYPPYAYVTSPYPYNYVAIDEEYNQNHGCNIL